MPRRILIPTGARTPGAPEEKDTSLVTMSNAATDLAPSTDHVVALVRRWLAESAEYPADPARRAPRRGAEGPARPRLHPRLRRRRHAAGRPARRRPQPRAASRRLTPSSCPGTCAPRSALGGVFAPVLPVARHPDRAPGAAPHGRPPRRRRDARRSSARRIAQLREPRHPAQPQPARRGRARRGRGRPPPRRHPRAARPRRRRLRLDQGVVASSSQLSMWAFDETVERVVERLTPLYELAAASAHAEVHQPRHGGVPRPRPHRSRCSRRLLDQPQLQRPRGRHRAAGLPARRARRAAGAHRVGDRAPRAPAARRHQGARRQGREPRDGARRRRRCTAGRSRPTAPSRRPTPTTSACSTGR